MYTRFLVRKPTRKALTINHLIHHFIHFRNLHLQYISSRFSANSDVPTKRIIYQSLRIDEPVPMVVMVSSMSHQVSRCCVKKSAAARVSSLSSSTSCFFGDRWWSWCYTTITVVATGWGRAVQRHVKVKMVVL